MNTITDLTHPNISIELPIQRCIFGTEHTDCVVESRHITLKTTVEDTLKVTDEYATTAHRATIIREYPDLETSFNNCMDVDIAEFHAVYDDTDPDIIFSECVVSFLYRVPKSHLNELKYLRFVETLTNGLAQ